VDKESENLSKLAKNAKKNNIDKIQDFLSNSNNLIRLSSILTIFFALLLAYDSHICLKVMFRARKLRRQLS
jgi:peptidoglycan biosynthesis protein MviN/MurJ (putative lipid II flippase)